MKHKDYWRRRFEQLEDAQLHKGLAYYADLEREYIKAVTAIEQQISAWYRRFAQNNQVSYADAKRLLNSNELAELRWSVNEYIKYGKENAVNGQWIKQLENASARVHISRLEALQLQLQQQVEVLCSNQLSGMDKTMRGIYTDGYYHSAYEIQRGFNVGWDLQRMSDRQLSAVLAKPWAADGKNFSARIWGNKDQLINTLHTELSQALIRGDPPDKMIKAMAGKMNTSKNNAGRLVMTESAFFASAAQRDCFNDLDVEQYEIVATLDGKTSEICQSLDGKVFPMSDYKVGVTAPPFHCYCRTVTVPYFDDNTGERVARDSDGKTYYVPDNMKYPEWHDRYVTKETEKKYQAIIGLTAQNGVKISAVSNHLVERAIQRGVSAEAASDALLNPLKIGKIKVAENGRSQTYTGEYARVTVNPDTGNIITVWKTASKLRKKLKGGK